MYALSPKASHYVAHAMRFASAHDRALWDTLDKDTSGELPKPVALAALRALRLFEKKVADRLNTSGLDADEVADHSNTLGTIQAIERGLEREYEPVYAAAAFSR